MITYNKFITGLTEYIDVEIVGKLVGYPKWIFGTLVGVALSRAINIFNTLKENEMIKMLGIIDKENNIDIEVLYTELKKQAHKEAITFDVPMLGSLTLTETDVDKVYNYMKKGI